jgi:hypothetical protein
MGNFSFLETGFFFTLAITFLLMLLLVYHFKQRLITTEQKQDTMFEIINNLVHEFNNIKSTIALMNRPSTPYPYQTQNLVNELNKSQISDNENSLDVNHDEIETLEEYDEDEEDDDELIVVSDDEDDNISVEELNDEIETEELLESPDIEDKEEAQEEEQEVQEEKSEEKPNFSKMNLGSLKTYILEQGWVDDASKMKKSQILDLIKVHAN